MVTDRFTDKLPVARDIFERMVGTAAAAIAAQILSDAANWQDVLKVDNWKGWAFVGAASAFTFLKGLLATQVAKRNGRASSASLDPAVQLQPTSR